MSAPKTPEECMVLNGAGGPKWAETRAAIEAYAAEKVREATEGLTKERDDLRRAAGTFTPGWANAVWNPLVKLLSEHAAVPPGGSTFVEMLNRIIGENADLRARLEAIRKTWYETGGFYEADFETLLNRALDLTRPFKGGGA